MSPLRPVIAPVLLTFAAFLLACGTEPADPGLSPPPLPPVPVVLAYTTWSHHLIQWLPEVSPYETVEALIDDASDDVLVHFFVTERESVEGSKRQHHYTTTADLAERLCPGSGDRTCVRADIEYEATTEGDSPSFRIALETADGAVEWSFVANDEPRDEYGAGLIDNADAEHDLKGGLLAFYLGQSALSSDSSRVTVAGEVHTVAEWPELSAEPFFTAYRGSYSRDVHLGYFPVLAPLDVRAVQSAETYEAGAEWLESWQLEGEPEPTTHSIVLRERDGDRLTLRSAGLETHAQLQANGDLLTSSVALEQRGAIMKVVFDPPLPNPLTLEETSHVSSWRLEMAGRDALMSGTITLDHQDGVTTIELDPLQPEWSVPLRLHTRIEKTQDGYRRTAWTSYPGSE